MAKKRRVFHRGKAAGYPLHEHVDLDHPLVVLANIIDWDAIERVVPVPAVPGPGRPAVRTRLIAGLLYLEYAFKLSDSEVVALWLENPYIWTVACEQPLFQ